MTEQQLYIHRLAHRVRHLFCRACGAEAPRFSDGLCDECGNAASPARQRIHLTATSGSGAETSVMSHRIASSGSEGSERGEESDARSCYAV